MKKTLTAMMAALIMVLSLTGCMQATGQTLPEGTSGEEETTPYTAVTIDTDSASSLTEQEYANVPGAPTQNAVTEYTVTYGLGTEEESHLPVPVLEPDELIVAALEDIYNFVQETDKMPVRYFLEEVQQAVETILAGASPDILHISEFFGIQPEFLTEREEDALGELVLDEEYTPGQLVVVMFGDTTGADTSHLETIQWTPLKAQVQEPGKITFQIPPHLQQDTDGEETLFLVLTIRKGNSGTGEQDSAGEAATAFVPSKDVSDLTTEQEQVTSADGTLLPDDFRIFIREHNETTRKEIQRLQQFMIREESPVAAYFAENLQKQMTLLTGAEAEALICYNANFLGAENYEDTYGDVIAGFRFATAYQDGSQVVCLLGTRKDPLPQQSEDGTILPEESLFDWAVLRGEVKDGYVYITFPQQLIPVMEEEGALALILSQPTTGEENQTE